MTESLLAGALERFLAGRCDLRRVREIEADESGDRAAGFWAELHETGFADAIVADGAGGAGLTMREAADVSLACGRHAIPVPLSLTMAVRAYLSEAGIPVPAGAITVAFADAHPEAGGLAADAVPYGLAATWVLLSTPAGELLVRTDAAHRSRWGGRGSLSADLKWAAAPPGTIALGVSGPGRADWMAIAAALIAAEMAGAMERVATMTIAYAGDRAQFGRPIGRFQAIQHQVSVMAGECAAARSAALFALSCDSWRIDPLRAAVAKSRAGEAAAVVASIGHAVHGAIGMTEEYDLQMLTRRLLDWRSSYGGRGYWSRRLGCALLDSALPPLQFIEQRVVAGGGMRA